MPGDANVLDPSADRARPGVLTSLRRHVRLIIVLALLGGIAGYGVSFLLPTSYRAQSAVLFGVAAPFNPAGTETNDPVRFTADQVELAVTSEVLGAAGARLTPPLTAEEVRPSVSAVGSVETSKMTITVERPDAEQARALADAVAGAYVGTALQRVANASAAAQDAINDGFIEEQIRLRAAAYGNGVTVVEPAVLPLEAAAPLPRQNALIGGLVGLLLATALAVMRDQRRARRASVADLDLLIGAPLITRYAAPSVTTPAAIAKPDQAPEQIRAVHDVLAAIDVALEGEQHRTVLFLSWQRALTTTSLVVAGGLAAARAGQQVVLIDGGLKERGISALTDVDPGLGLEGLARPETPVNTCLRSWWVQNIELNVVPLDGWTTSPTGAAARPQVLRSATARLRDISSLVLVDGPPLTERSLGLALGRGVDGVVLVIDAETSIDDAHEMGRRIALAGASVLGYVLAGPARTGAMSRISWAPKRIGEGPVSLGASEGARRA